MSHFLRGQIIAVGGTSGTVQEINSWQSSPTGRFAALSFEDVRFIDIDVHRRDLTFGPASKQEDDGITIKTLRKPVIGDIIVFTMRWDNGKLRVVNWTYEVHYKQCENQLPRCAYPGGCGNAPRLTWRFCDTHAEEHYQGLRDLEEEEEIVTPETVLARAITRFGNTEAAHEAARTDPGSFI